MGSIGSSVHIFLFSCFSSFLFHRGCKRLGGTSKQTVQQMLQGIYKSYKLLQNIPSLRTLVVACSENSLELSGQDKNSMSFFFVSCLMVFVLRFFHCVQCTGTDTKKLFAKQFSKKSFRQLVSVRKTLLNDIQTIINNIPYKDLQIHSHVLTHPLVFFLSPFSLFSSFAKFARKWRQPS